MGRPGAGGGSAGGGHLRGLDPDGQAIPDERLEAFPLAELTVEEATVRDRNLGGRRELESRMGPSSDPFRVFDDPAAQDHGLAEDEGSDDEPGPQANLGVRTIPET